MVPCDGSWGRSPEAGGSPPKVAHPHDWPVVLAIEWKLSGGRQSGLSFFFMWPPHVAQMDSQKLGSVREHPRPHIKRSRSRVQALTKPPFCILLADVSLIKTSHMANPRVNVGRDYTP